MSFFDTLKREANQLAEEYISDMNDVNPEDLGLDRRAGYNMWVADDMIACDSASIGVLDYYGGFEYIEREFRFQLGDYYFFSAYSDRVQDCIDYYQEQLNEKDAA